MKLIIEIGTYQSRIQQHPRSTKEQREKNGGEGKKTQEREEKKKAIPQL